MRGYPGIAVLVLLTAAGAPAQDVEVSAYTVPRPVEPTIPNYPGTEAARGDEGLVKISFMVDTEGKVFDPIVAQSTGSERFHEAALKALSTTRFTPAELDGEPIVGSASVLYQFVMPTGAQGASNVFAGLYRNFQRALRDEDEAAMQQALAELEDLGASNRYENAFLDLARYYQAARSGTAAEQMRYLHGALSASSSPDDPVYLDAAVVRDLRRLLLPLQVRQKFFPDALDTYALMGVEGDTEAVAFFAETMAQVEAVARDDTAYSIPLRLDESGETLIRVFKRRLAFVGGAGRVDELRLHCERHYVAFAIERDVEYSVPGAWGKCSLHVVGDPGAEFQLVQN